MIKTKKMKIKKTGNKEVEKIRKKILPLLKKNKVSRAGIFGSYARGEQKKNSDIDILVKISEDISLLDFIGLKLKLEEILGRKIDLVEYSTIKSRIRNQILNEEIRII